MGEQEDELKPLLKVPHHAVNRPVPKYCLLAVTAILLLCIISVSLLVFQGQIKHNSGIHSYIGFPIWNVEPSGSVNKSTDAQCGISKGSDRFDCWPEFYGATQKKCESRGCCWSPQVERGGPYCYYPRNFMDGYKLMRTEETPNGMIGYLQRTTKSPYPKDSMKLQFQITGYKTNQNPYLEIKIYDPDVNRYHVPLIVPQQSSSTNSEVLDQDVDIKLTKEPFGITITRKSTAQVLFDSTGVSPLVFADQFLQIGTKLSSPNIYGLGEHRSSFKLDTNWTKIVFWNRDQPPEVNDNLYGSHPFYMNLDSHNTNTAYGVFMLNSNAMEVTLQPYNSTGALTYRSIGGILDIFVFLGPTPDLVVQQYTALIGRPFLPPFWSLGFHLCKYGYYSAEELRKVIARNRAAEMPYDVQWNDIDYMNAYLDWTYNTTSYSGLPDIVADLHSNGQRYVIIVDPGISVTQKPGTYPPYDEGLKDDIFVKTYNGSNLIGKVWPGLTVFPDFFNPLTLGWWYRQAKAYHDVIPYDGLWVDMNEPSNFVTGSTTGCPGNSLDSPPFVPPSILGGSLMSGTLCPSAKQNISSHYNLHNMYGLSEMIATDQVLERLLKRRSIVLSRSTFPSAGRYGLHWLGDNLSSWTDLYYSIPGMLNFQLFGIPFVGVDICGFRGDTTSELCTRWMQLGAFYPFMRNHNSGKKDQDPGSFDTSTQNIMRSALQIRYTLLPLLYTLLYHSHTRGSAVIRPLFFQYPEMFANDKQFLWGSSLLVSPVLQQGATSVSAYIPNDVWYDYYNMTRLSSVGRYVTLDAPLDKINVHVRGGSIIPTKPSAVTTTKLRTEMFSLLVALGNEGASGDLYWDDGDSLDVIKKELYSYILFTADMRSLRNEVVAANYKQGVEMSLAAVAIMGVADNPSSVTVNGKTASFTYSDKTKVVRISGLSVDLLQPLLIKW